jgi:ribosome-associated translation inhibitor RaiA
MAQHRPREPLPATLGKRAKRYAGTTGAAETPLNLRAHGVSLDPTLEDYVRERAGRKLGKFATNIERVTVRFEDENGPKGGVDIDCKIKLVMRAAPTVMVTEVASDPRDAFDFAMSAAEQAVRRGLGKRGRASPRARKPSRRETLKAARALTRTVSSARPDRAEGGSTGGRNRKRSAPKASVALEGSATARPSRKSTRAGANRVKPDAPKRLTTMVARVAAPQARKARQTRRPR